MRCSILLRDKLPRLTGTKRQPVEAEEAQRRRPRIARARGSLLGGDQDSKLSLGSPLTTLSARDMTT